MTKKKKVAIYHHEFGFESEVLPESVDVWVKQGWSTEPASEPEPAELVVEFIEEPQVITDLLPVGESNETTEVVDDTNMEA